MRVRSAAARGTQGRRGRRAPTGLVDVSVLIGWFTMVCMTPAAFDLPADAGSTGLDQ